MPKQTRLEEIADIYQPRKEKTELEKLHEMKFTEKLSYLWEYYKIHAAVIIGIIAFVVYVVYEIITPNVKPQFYAAIINSSVNPDTLKEFENNFASDLQLDPKRESVELNDTFYENGFSQYALGSQQALTAFITAGDVDVIIAPESYFKSYAYNGYFAKLSDELPTDIYSSLTDNFYLDSQKSDPEKTAYGINLTNSNLFKDRTYNNEPYILGIVPNHRNEENTVEFIKYLFQK